jgi:hypothetical protein
MLDLASFLKIDNMCINVLKVKAKFPYKNIDQSLFQYDNRENLI